VIHARSHYERLDAAVATAARTTAALTLLLVTARSWVPLPYAAQISSIALGLSIVLLVVACARTAYASSGMLRPLFTGLAIAELLLCAILVLACDLHLTRIGITSGGNTLDTIPIQILVLSMGLQANA